mmetsp:Transcript_14249/g.13819  ORF Transcript_14249/g.13819 Transcript_14249/m.13819 type:complete len:88 (-) Transcript_14249:104-367(-)
MTKDQLYNQINNAIREQCLHSLKAVKGKLNTTRKHCFEFVGYDFILDQELQVYLIEVNTNPCIEESSGLLRTLLPRLIDDLFKLTVD